ncbi:hypothetical protein D3C80_2103570 [compost metagenome]
MRKMASGLAARTFCICGSAVVVPREIISSETTCMPAFSRAALNDLVVSWLSSVLSDTTATLLYCLLAA